MNGEGIQAERANAAISSLLEACKDYRVWVDRLETENARLRAELAECRQTIEDVCGDPRDKDQNEILPSN